MLVLGHHRNAANVLYFRRSCMLPAHTLTALCAADILRALLDRLGVQNVSAWLPFVRVEECRVLLRFERFDGACRFLRLCDKAQVYRDSTHYRLHLERSNAFKMLDTLHRLPVYALPRDEIDLRKFALRHGVYLTSLTFLHEVPALHSLLRVWLQEHPSYESGIKTRDAKEAETKLKLHPRQTVAVVLHNGGLVVVNAPYLRDLEAWHFAKTRHRLRRLSFRTEAGQVGTVVDEAGYAEAMQAHKQETPIMVAHV